MTATHQIRVNSACDLLLIVNVFLKTDLCVNVLMFNLYLCSLLCIFLDFLYLIYGYFAGNPLSQDILNLYQEPDGTRKLLNYMLDNLAGEWLSCFASPHNCLLELVHIFNLGISQQDHIVIVTDN